MRTPGPGSSAVARAALATTAAAVAAAIVVVGGSQLLAAEYTLPPVRPPSTTPVSTRGPTDPKADPTTDPPSQGPTSPPADVEPMPTEAPPITGAVVELSRFDSPTGNLQCHVVADIQVYCEANEHTYDPPPVPEDCEGDWGDAIWIAEDGAVGFSCHTDTVDPTDDRLAYGETTVVGNFACQSRESGITCWDQRTGHGFSIARGAYALF